MSAVSGLAVRHGYAGKVAQVWRTADEDLKLRLVWLGVIVVGLNLAIWGSVLLLSSRYGILLGLAPIAYGFGLRHAVDPDHIAAIDNTTRKLMQDGQRPVAVAFFFSLGHSSIVFALSVLIAFSAAYIRTNLPGLEHTGTVIGTSVSGIFLLIIAVVNVLVLADIYKTWRKVTRGGSYDERALNDFLQNRGLLTRLFRPVLRLVSKSWHMYVVGLLFGLGFDTASEVGILGMSALGGTNAMPVWYILLLPLLFVAGMSLVDTLDGVAMLGAYGWAYVRPVRKLYYNLTITLVSVLVAVFIGGIEVLNVVRTETNATGGLWDWVNNAPFDVMGYAIIAILMISWLISIIVYKLRRLDRWDEEIVHVSTDRSHV